jgi:hypothetical protein
MTRVESETACACFFIMFHRIGFLNSFGLSSEAANFLEVCNVYEQLIFKERSANRQEWKSSIL